MSDSDALGAKNAGDVAPDDDPAWRALLRAPVIVDPRTDEQRAEEEAAIDAAKDGPFIPHHEVMAMLERRKGEAMTAAAERDQGVTEPRASETRRELEAMLEEHRDAWVEWLRAVQVLGAETDPVRAAEAAREVMAKAPHAVRARLEMLPLMRLEIRWRMLDPVRTRFTADIESGVIRVPR